MTVADADVARYTRFVTSRPDIEPTEIQTAATRAVLTAIDRDGRLLPPTRRLATFMPGGPGRPSRAVVHLDGAREIFRFMINLLGVQLDISEAARIVLVDLRDRITPAEFDPMARALLGETRYQKLAPQFERDWTCRGCDQTIRPGRRFSPTEDGGAACSPCGRNIPELAGTWRTRVAPSKRKVAPSKRKPVTV